MKLKKIAEWLISHDTGVSSLALCAVELGGKFDFLNWPIDPSDFGRCVRFLNKCVTIPKGLLADMAAQSDEWQTIYHHWDELLDLWNEEKDLERAPKLYKRMKELGL